MHADITLEMSRGLADIPWGEDHDDFAEKFEADVRALIIGKHRDRRCRVVLRGLQAGSLVCIAGPGFGNGEWVPWGPVLWSFASQK